MPTDSRLLISMPEIAELAGVKRPVVTVWRRRYQKSFPAPVPENAGRPLFDARAVLDWLVETGRADRDVLEPDLRQHTIWHLGSRMKPEDLLSFATALICLRALDGDEPLRSDDAWAADLAQRASRIDPADKFLQSEIKTLPEDTGWLIEAVDDLVEAAWGCRQAFERLLAARNRLNVPMLYHDAISPDLAGLIARVSGAAERLAVHGTVTVIDPWAGTGDLLTAVMAALGENGQPIVSASTSEDLARLVRRRLSVWDLPTANIDVRTQRQSKANPAWHLMVTALPYRSLENRSRDRQLRFVAQIAAVLGPDQTAVVLGPADLLCDQLAPAEVGIRNEILRTDAVEAVITLPGGLMPFRPGYQTGLWILRRDESGRGQGRVLHADISDQPLTAQTVDDLVEDITTWRREGYHPAAHRRALTSPASVADLLSGHSSLSGLRQPDLPEATSLRHARVAQLLDLRTRLAEHAKQPPGAALITNIAARDDHARPTVTIAGLAKNKVLRRLKGARIADTHVTGEGHHRLIGMPELAGQLRRGQRMIDRLVLAAHYPHVRLTEPGDVIIAAGAAAYVDIEGFSVVEYPVAALRVSGDGRTMTPRALAALITTAANGRAPGAVRTRRLDEITLPVLEPDEVEELDRLLAQIDQQRRWAREQLDILDTLSCTAVTGIADGTLTITPHQ